MNERTRFNYVKNRDKAFANLISIIDGILSDGTLDQKEILYLWIGPYISIHFLSLNP